MVTTGSKLPTGVPRREIHQPIEEPPVTNPADEKPLDPSARAHPTTRDVGRIYAEHAEFVWKNLFRLGVREDDLEDMVQEVFMVVHRRIDRFDGSSRMTTWLFGIAMRVASAYHRRAHRRRERPTDFDDESLVLAARAAVAETPEDAAAHREAGGALERILDAMDIEKRATFVLFELDSMSCAEIAALTDVPVGTVYSRLNAARAIFEREAARLRGGKRGAR
jgi:RNA polymerase sigma-70 factor (ECF subfamily)